MNPWQRIILTLTIALTGLEGCVSAASPNFDSVAQVIVKFKSAIAQPADAALLKDLANSAHLKVSHVRPMSGGAQIYLLRGFANDGELKHALKHLSARSDVEYVELDQKMKPQKSANE